jgi:hypothetical protein
MKHGFTAVLQDRKRWHGAAWNVLGVEVATTASAPRHRAAWQRGVEDDRGVRVGWAVQGSWASPSARGKLF